MLGECLLCSILARAHQMPIAALLSPTSFCDNQKCLQVLPFVPWGKNYIIEVPMEGLTHICLLCLAESVGHKTWILQDERVSIHPERWEEHYEPRGLRVQTLRNIKWPGTVPRLWAVQCGWNVAATSRWTGADPGGGGCKSRKACISHASDFIL